MLDDYFGYIYDPKLFLNTIMIKVFMVKKVIDYFKYLMPLMVILVINDILGQLILKANPMYSTYRLQPTKHT